MPSINNNNNNKTPYDNCLDFFFPRLPIATILADENGIITHANRHALEKISTLATKNIGIPEIFSPITPLPFVNRKDKNQEAIFSFKTQVLTKETNSQLLTATLITFFCQDGKFFLCFFYSSDEESKLKYFYQTVKLLSTAAHNPYLSVLDECLQKHFSHLNTPPTSPIPLLNFQSLENSQKIAQIIQYQSFTITQVRRILRVVSDLLNQILPIHQETANCNNSFVFAPPAFLQNQEQVIETKAVDIQPAKLKVSKSGLRILIVDDSLINRKTLAKQLTNLGYAEINFGFAIDGEDAVEKFKAASYHVTFMDQEMPKLSGCEATREIRHYEQEKGDFNTSVIGFSTLSEEEMKKNKSFQFLSAYLHKPATSVAIQQKLEEFFEFI